MDGGNDENLGMIAETERKKNQRKRFRTEASWSACRCRKGGRYRENLRRFKAETKIGMKIMTKMMMLALMMMISQRR